MATSVIDSVEREKVIAYEKIKKIQEEERKGPR